MRRWNTGPKVLVFSAVALLLSLGLCSTTGNIIADGGDQALWGLGLFFIGAITFVVGLGMTMMSGMRREE